MLAGYTVDDKGKRARETGGSESRGGKQRRTDEWEDEWVDRGEEGILLDIDELVNDDQQNIDDEEGAEWWGEDGEGEAWVGGVGPEGTGDRERELKEEHSGGEARAQHETADDEAAGLRGSGDGSGREGGEEGGRQRKRRRRDTTFARWEAGAHDRMVAALKSRRTGVG